MQPSTLTVDVATLRFACQGHNSFKYRLSAKPLLHRPHNLVVLFLLFKPFQKFSHCQCMQDANIALRAYNKH